MQSSTSSQPSGHLLKIGAYYAAYIVLGAAVVMFGPTLVTLAKNTHTDINQISLLFSAHALGYLLGSLGSGRLLDRLPGHPLIAGALFITAALLALVPLLPSLWLLVGVAFMLGAACSLIDVGGNALIIWVVPRQVAPYLNGLHFFFGVGGLLAPLLVAQSLERTQTITWAYWILALAMVPIALALGFIPSPTRKPAASVQPDRRPQIGLIVLTATLLFLYVGTEAGFANLLTTYLVKSNLAIETTAAYLTSGFWMAFTLGRLIGIPLAARVRPRYILLADLLISLASVGLLLLGTHSLLITGVGTVCLGLGLASIFPTALALAERRMHITGQITSWFFAGSSLGGMTMPWLSGQLFKPVGPPAVLYVIGGCILLSLGVLAAIIQSTTPRPSPDLVESPR